MKKPRAVEDPHRIQLFIEAITPLSWSDQAYVPALTVLFKQLSDLTQAEIFYYYSKRCHSRRISGACRFFAWALVSMGIIAPLIQPLLNKEYAEVALRWGYVAFGAAGAVMIFDSLFAGTGAHQRYTSTQLELEKVYTIFGINWQASMLKLSSEMQSNGAGIGDGSRATTALAMLKSAAEYSSEMHRVLGAETSAWQEAVNKGLSEVRQKIGSSAKGSE